MSLRNKFGAGNFLKYFKFYYSRLKWRVPLLIVMSVLVAFFDGIGLVLFIPLFQMADSVGQGSMDTDLGGMGFLLEFLHYIDIPLTIWVVVGIIVVVFILKGIVNYINMLLVTSMNVRFGKSLRLSLYEGLFNVTYRGFVNTDLGRIQNIFTTELGRADRALNYYLSCLRLLLIIIGYLGLAFLANIEFALFIVAAGLGSNFIYSFINRKVETSSLDISYLGHEIQGKSLESLWNFKYLKATDSIPWFRQIIFRLVDKIADVGWRMGKLNSISASLREPFSIILVALIILIFVVSFEASLSSILVSLMLFFRGLTNILSLQTSWQSFLVNSGAIHTTNDLIEYFDSNIECVENLPCEDFKEKLEFREVTFSYPDSKEPVLKNVSFKVNKNETIAFVGESGAGKTTIINMLAGLFLPNNGDIYIDKVVLDSSIVRSYRQKIGYITQESVVFNDTVYNNVTQNAVRSPENISKFWDVIDKAALRSTVNQMPKKENSVLGNNGVLISGGQKQRISIARELFRDCSILIMDEATSALDSENEALIQASINELKGKYTIIIIAHRLSTIKRADCIYVLDKGKVSASGSFNELQKNSTIFKRMIVSQEFK
jgi:subfamily B ATP-binding cassette protein MsbA